MDLVEWADNRRTEQKEEQAVIQQLQGELQAARAEVEALRQENGLLRARVEADLVEGHAGEQAALTRAHAAEARVSELSAEVEALNHQLSIAYDHITRGQWSKPNTPWDVIVAALNAVQEQERDEAYEEGKQEGLDAAEARATQAEHRLESLCDALTAAIVAKEQAEHHSAEWCERFNRAHAAQTRLAERLAQAEHERDAVKAKYDLVLAASDGSCSDGDLMHMVEDIAERMTTTLVEKYKALVEKAANQVAAAEKRATRVEADKLELMQAFGAISRAVAAIDKGSDNTPWQDVVARIERIGACWDEGLRQAVGEAHLRQQAEQLVEENEGVIRVWRRRTEEAEQALASRDVELAASYEVRDGHVAIIERLLAERTTKEQALADCRRQVAEATGSNEALRAEHATVREALAFYADESNWCEVEYDSHTFRYINRDAPWQTALAALMPIDAALPPQAGVVGCPDCGERPMDGHSPDCRQARTNEAQAGEEGRRG